MLQNYDNDNAPPRKQSKKKKLRKDKDIVDIDGKKQEWGKFKESWIEDVSARTSKGQLIKRQTFIMNKDKENEKLLKWHYKNGYNSEDSDDPYVKQNSAKRQWHRKMEEDHGKDTVFLQAR